MKITILGCGASAGVPLIGCDCAVCTSADPRNKRTRVSILLEEGGRKLLIDTSPDLRQQALAAGVTTVDAILITHDHADHTHGIDDVRSFNFTSGEQIPLYTDENTLATLQTRFPYVFLPKPQYVWSRPSIIPHIINANEPFEAAGFPVLPLYQHHGKTGSLGFRIGNIAYSPDTNKLPEETWEQLHGLDLWIVDCLRYETSYTHAHLEMALEWIARVKPKRAILTHMSHAFDYTKLSSETPAHVEPAYDNMVIEL